MIGHGFFPPSRTLLLIIFLTLFAPACKGEMELAANPDVVDVSDFDDVTSHQDTGASIDVHTPPDIEMTPDVTSAPDTSSPPDVDDAPLFDCRNAQSWPQDWGAFETEVVRLFNERRAAGATCGNYGAFAAAPALTMHVNVHQAARCHSVDMFENTTMSHTGSDGSTLGQRLNREGYSGWSAAAENVARSQSTPQAVVSAWMNSAGHCRNIMGPNYSDVGIGFVNRYWTAKFGRK